MPIALQKIYWLQQLGIAYYKRRGTILVLKEYLLAAPLLLISDVAFSRLTPEAAKILTGIEKFLAIDLQQVAFGYVAAAKDTFNMAELQTEINDVGCNCTVVFGDIERYSTLASSNVFVTHSLEEMALHPKLKVHAHQELLRLKEKVGY